jgi:hypothetical protein
MKRGHGQRQQSDYRGCARAFTHDSNHHSHRFLGQVILKLQALTSKHRKPLELSPREAARMRIG